jgi:predicted TIM-barrel fold metal-dependent hydrolase
MTPEVSRRDFLKTAIALTAATAGGSVVDAAQSRESVDLPSPAGQGALVDANISLSRWPFRRLPLDETPALVARLRSRGVTQAWAGTFDALLHKDLGNANARLAAECRKNGRGMFVPFGSVNLALPDWEEEVRRCHEEHKMPGLRLHPNYHGYSLGDARFARLLDLAGDRGLILQLAVMMEDERTQHPLVRVPHVDVGPLPLLLKDRPGMRIVLLNWGRGVSGSLLPKLAKAGQVFFDIATVEGVGGVAALCQQVTMDRVLLGSYAPFFYLESALLKLKESVLSESGLAAVRAGNARRLLAGR